MQGICTHDLSIKYKVKKEQIDISNRLEYHQENWRKFSIMPWPRLLCVAGVYCEGIVILPQFAWLASSDNDCFVFT